MSGEAIKLADAQVNLFGKITRTGENLRKIGTAKTTQGVVEACLQGLEKKWSKFDEQDDLLFAHRDTLRDHEYFKQDLPFLAEEAYLQQKGALLELLQGFDKKEAKTASGVDSAPSSHAPRTTLPRIQLPHFSGKYEDWPAFRDLFCSIIDKDASITQVEKLHYLKTCLKGEAELLIRDLSTTSENFARAWDTLSAYYENKRLLVRAYFSSFLALPKIKNESAVELRKVFHGVKSVVSSLESINRPISSNEDLFVYLAVELLDTRSRREWENSISDSVEPPSYKALERFLERRLHTLESMSPVQKVDRASPKAESKTTRSHHTRKQEAKLEGQRGRCSLCQKDHFVMLCDSYKKKTASDRKQHIEGNDLCINCLGRHKVEDCHSKKNCTACGNRHHTSLHDAFRDTEVATTAHIAQRSSETHSVVLATARVRVADRHGKWHSARALLDQGSESSFISDRLAKRLKLPLTPVAVAVLGVGGQKTGTSRGRVTLTLSPRGEGSSIELAALVLPWKLTAYSGASTLGSNAWPHLQGLSLADPDYKAADPIGLILGADVYGEILMPGLRKGTRHEPVLQNTTLGWILFGSADSDSFTATVHSYHCQVDDDLSKMVRRFWTQEELPSATPSLSKAEIECEEHYVRTHWRKPDGRYVVRLPRVTALPNLAGTRHIALRALKHMEIRFIKNTACCSLYHEFMQEYLQLDHMVAMPAPAANTEVCYLPHHGVLRESSATTKLRVVFNGSASLKTGSSLNQYLHCGPNLLPPLADVLLRWRRHRYVFATDVEKMYRQIEVYEQDRDLQRILWRSSPEKDVQEYQLKTVTYGLACAPFLAIRTLHQLAHDEKSRYPLGSAVLLKDVYMDDILTGASTIKAAKELLRQLTGICLAGGFPLKKWSANDASLLEEVPAKDRLQRDPRWWLPGESHLTLGLLWLPHEDLFAFSLSFPPLDFFSKRTVLSLAARLFDPLGWLSPVTVRAKIWIQAAWLRGVAWDDPLPETDALQWQNWQAELPRLGDIRIPRWLAYLTPDSNQEVHGFADASEKAFAAVAYLRTRDRDDRVKVSLIAAKTKVAPLKQVTLPRLELCAATLLTRLVAHIRPALETVTTPIHLWTDSTVALGWIQGHPASWKTYVANRVSEIQTTLPDVIWHHTPGRDNPADCASRGLSPAELKNHSLWWSGPPWLQESPDQWPVNPINACGADPPEQRLCVHQTATDNESADEPELLARYSELHRLLRVTAWCRRWLRLRKTDEFRRNIHLSTSELLPAELDEALIGWIKVVQAIKFKKELVMIKKTAPLPAKGELTKLSPFLDNKGILRVGGRLSNAPIPHEARHPTLLPSTSQLTQLLIKATHLRTLHGGVHLTLATLRQEYWVPRGRALVKYVIHRCLPCVRWRAATPQPLMGNLPAPRVTPSRPFLHSGVDYAGPIWLRTAKGRGHRAYKSFLVIFVCLSCRAVHLDVASEYTSDAFLAVLRRFISRRGLCKVLYSDRGTNFVGADKQLRSLFSANSQEGRRITAHLADERIEWRFNPPAAPNFGGLWEAAVKSVKHHLRRVIGEAKLTYEEMATLLAQIESCLNSRPLQPMSDDQEDLEALTPGHFLVGTALNAIPTSPPKEEPRSLATRWKLLNQLRDNFWTRWSKEYLHSLAHRPKWLKADEEVRVGRLCLLRSEQLPPNKWPLARIESLHPGRDGHVRVVDVRTATRNLTRPVNKLVLLPVSSDTPRGND